MVWDITDTTNITACDSSNGSMSTSCSMQSPSLEHIGINFYDLVSISSEHWHNYSRFVFVISWSSYYHKLDYKNSCYQHYHIFLESIWFFSRYSVFINWIPSLYDLVLVLSGVFLYAGFIISCYRNWRVYDCVLFQSS